MNEHRIAKELKKLKKFDSRKDSKYNQRRYFKRFKKLYDGHKQLLGAQYYTNSFTCFRARKGSDGYYERICDVWHPPPNVAPGGRLNYKGKPLFYCSTDINTVLIEIRPSLNDIVTVLEIQITEPVLNSIQFVRANIPPGSLDAMNPDKRIFYNFLADEMRKEVAENETQKYYATQIFESAIDHPINGQKYDAIAYESVATNHNGYNFAIKPRFVSLNSAFISAHVMKIIKFQDRQNFTAQCLMLATSISSVGTFEFKHVICSGHDISILNFNHH